jgi:hypothetical protein
MLATPISEDKARAFAASWARSECLLKWLGTRSTVTRMSRA